MERTPRENKSKLERQKMKIKNIFGHLKTILKHKWEVLKLSIKAGIPIRGLFHDMSKFSLVEFIESVKYYQGGKRSPLGKSREENGYSKAWLHHKGRNKHHLEYWYDEGLREQPVVPYKYVVETICDKLAASKVYGGKSWTKESELKYWQDPTKENGSIHTNQKTKNFIEEVFIQVAKEGIDKIITKQNLKKLYKKYCE